jgi:RNA polymerase sigma-70 factor (ECF subfamily)
VETAEDIDRALVEAAKRGDGDAYTQLIDKYHGRVFGIICRMCGYQDAEDIAQDVFVRALKALRNFQFHGQASFRTWLYRIAVNAAINELRTRGRRSHIIGPSLEEMEENDAGITERICPDYSQAPEVLAERDELRRAVHKALGQLSEGHRLVIVLVDLEGMPYEQAAKVVGCPVGTIKSRLARARTAFARVFEKYLRGRMRVDAVAG